MELTVSGKQLMDTEYLRLKSEFYKRYTGKDYPYTPLEARIYLPIVPKGFLAKFFGRP